MQERSTGNSIIERLINEDETIIWKGKPQKKAFKLQKIMPYLIISLFFGIGIVGVIKAIIEGEIELFTMEIIMLSLLSIPIIILLVNLFTLERSWNNELYIVTDKRIFFQYGQIFVRYNTLYYKDIGSVSLYKNAIENMFHVGSINFYVPSSLDHNSHRFYCIENVSQIYSIIQKAVIDIQTDIEYPNQLRPDENPGYNTQYRPK